MPDSDPLPNLTVFPVSRLNVTYQPASSLTMPQSTEKVSSPLSPTFVSTPKVPRKSRSPMKQDHLEMLFLSKQGTFTPVKEPDY